ncbi:ATP-binding protein [Nostoc sp. 'Peltigera malacea cyanobiont' DB3992]|uniref:ATP-binding protein n=1 Tax=Nostoc sp. 'Peltigera malacea cyanobiont' DB3992 TaxID=1206980 RepID=UPI000C04D464|nr:ATP-binding protein [Nostoc sp. 'Peltigera malacea cyanobiont' DB3992]PHM07494.1 histidine kinase [Nostoc sp. 'Peltigera malacea cyanobiont' DB3992]
MQSPNPISPSSLTSILTALKVCSDESVYAPGYIQPYGMLLMLQEPQLTILQISENVEQFFGISAEALLGQPLQRLFSGAQVRQLAGYLAEDNLELCNPFELKTRRVAEIDGEQKNQAFTGVMYRVVNGLIVELEPVRSLKSIDSIQSYHRLQAVIANFRNATSLTNLAQTLAREVKTMTGFDRVMIYRFLADDSGVVIAEEKQGHLESYLGLHYLAIDIAEPARKLFCRNWMRFIPDINYTPVCLIPTNHPSTDTPLDLSNSVLRGVFPCHIEYLHNMGVTGSMTISLINDKGLWGLIACHHYSPKLVDYETRKACEFLGQFASIEVVHQQDRESDVYRTQVKAIQDQLQQTLLQESNFIEQVLIRNTSYLLDLVHAQGAGILLDGHLTLVGQTPSATQVQELVMWLVQHNGERVFATDSVSRLYPEAEAFKDQASGILAISILFNHAKRKSYQIIWFRPEQIQTVNWAGKPQDTVTINEIGEMQLSPRKSFAMWKETVRETSLAWEVAEVEAATEMRNTLMLAVLEFSQIALEQAAEQAAIANRAKSQFLAKMSHELRTPLNAILGFTQLMNRSDKIPSEFQEDLGIISRSGEYLLTLINDVLEMSKIEAGQLHLTENSFDLHQLIHSIRDMVALEALDKGIDLRTEQHSSVPRYVYGDESKLRQILLNLLSNAIKFTTTGSVTLRLQALNGRVDSISTDDSKPIITLHLEVEDTGCGIAQSDIEAVFQAFTQTESGRQAKGTGLGLSISRQFARLMGGDITARSILNQQSTFICEVLLSLVSSVDIIAPETTGAVIGLEPGQPSYRILVAEDVRENRLLLVRLLELVGFEVCAVENGKEAIALWSEWHPHLILMDIEMPVMNGYESTRQIRGMEGGKEVVIIAVTAYAFEEDYTTSIQAGCNDHITKPFLEAVLFDRIAHYLGVRYRYSEEVLPGLDQQTLVHKSLTAKDLQVMSPEWMIQAHQAALDLNDTELHNLIAQIPNQEQVLANALKYLVDNFQMEAIATLTETVLSAE